jgi:hypothetical protein
MPPRVAAGEPGRGSRPRRAGRPNMASAPGLCAVYLIFIADPQALQKPADGRLPDLDASLSNNPAVGIRFGHPGRPPTRPRRGIRFSLIRESPSDSAYPGTALTAHARSALQTWLKEPARHGANALFPNVHGGRLSADSVQSLLAKHVRAASESCPSLRPSGCRRTCSGTALRWSCWKRASIAP